MDNEFSFTLRISANQRNSISKSVFAKEDMKNYK